MYSNLGYAALSGKNKMKLIPSGKKKKLFFFQWVKINTKKGTVSEYMNPNAGRQGVYFIPCGLRISMVKRFALSITHMLGFLLKRAKTILHHLSEQVYNFRFRLVLKTEKNVLRIQPGEDMPICDLAMQTAVI